MPAEELTVADEASVVALWEAAGLTRPWNDPGADFRRAVAGPGSCALGVRRGEALVGAALVGDDGHRGWLYYVGVAPAHARRGVGAELVRTAEAWLARRGVAKVLLLVRRENEGVHGFYEALGYRGEDVVVMGRRLGDG